MIRFENWPALVAVAMCFAFCLAAAVLFISLAVDAWRETRSARREVSRGLHGYYEDRKHDRYERRSLTNRE